MKPSRNWIEAGKYKICSPEAIEAAKAVAHMLDEDVLLARREALRTLTAHGSIASPHVAGHLNQALTHDVIEMYSVDALQHENLPADALADRASQYAIIATLTELIQAQELPKLW